MRLLVIDDNRRLSEYVGVALRGQGFAVDFVDTGADAEAAISTTSYDAIILDLGLPDIDGLAWLTDARRRLDQTPVYVLTARDGVQDLVLGLNSGADDYLRKPFEIDELVARIRALLRRPGAALIEPRGTLLNTNTRELDHQRPPRRTGPARSAVALELLCAGPTVS